MTVLLSAMPGSLQKQRLVLLIADTTISCCSCLHSSQYHRQALCLKPSSSVEMLTCWPLVQPRQVQCWLTLVMQILLHLACMPPASSGW